MTETTMTIYRPGAAPEAKTVDLPAEPGYTALADLIRPLLDGANLEHVSVLFRGRGHDMFVDDEGAIKGLPVNPEATAIYRNAYLSRYPDVDPEEMPAIHGPAVLFLRRVWF